MTKAGGRLIFLKNRHMILMGYPALFAFRNAPYPMGVQDIAVCAGWKITG
jgi:hypothetical protein